MATYCDGVLFASASELTNPLIINDNELDFLWNYNLDELRISSVARSADEIAAYYAAAKDKIQ